MGDQIKKITKTQLAAHERALIAARLGRVPDAADIRRISGIPHLAASVDATLRVVGEGMNREAFARTIGYTPEKGEVGLPTRREMMRIVAKPQPGDAAILSAEQDRILRAGDALENIDRLRRVLSAAREARTAEPGERDSTLIMFLEDAAEALADWILLDNLNMRAVLSGKPNRPVPSFDDWAKSLRQRLVDDEDATFLTWGVRRTPEASALAEAAQMIADEEATRQLARAGDRAQGGAAERVSGPSSGAMIASHDGRNWKVDRVDA